MPEWMTQAIPQFLIFALPGFLAAAFFHEFTAHPKAGQFERTVQALILTAVLQAICGLAGLWKPVLSSWVAPYVLAPFAGLALAWAFNHDWPHRKLRDRRITRESSEPSPWCAAFARHKDSHVIIHLRDGRRIYAWAVEWPNQPRDEHFHLANVRWMNEDGSHIEGAPAMLLPSEDLSLVEFPEAVWPEPPNEQEQSNDKSP